MTIATIIQQQTEYFESNRTLPINFRIEQLKKLKQAIEKYEAQLLYGLAHDLKKAELEAYMTEIGLLYRHLDEMIKKLPTWSKKDRVKTPIFLQPAKSYTMRAPFGKALIISPFNYPVLFITRSFNRFNCGWKYNIDWLVRRNTIHKSRD